MGPEWGSSGRLTSGGTGSADGLERAVLVTVQGTLNKAQERPRK